jgi:putative transposase
MKLTIKDQCELLGISRSAYYYKPGPTVNEEDVRILKAIMEELRLRPFYGYRKITVALKDMNVTRKRIRLIMEKAGLRAVFPGKRLSEPNKEHEKYPYLLRGKEIWFPNQIWATDITYIKLSGGHVYLVAIIDLFSRKTLSWKLSNTIDTEFCIAALDEAIMIYGIPAIFNTDQGSQFTSKEFTDKLKSRHIRISMDGKGRALDNIFIERFWRSLKYEEIYLNEYRSMEDLKGALKRYFNFYNTERFHQSLEYETPDERYYSVFSKQCQEKAA